MKKLVILGPDQEDPGQVFWETFGISAIILGVLLFVFTTQVFIGQKKREEAKALAISEGKVIPPSFEISKRVATQKQLVLDEKYPWTFEEIEAAFNHGPKWLSEKACSFVYEDKKKLAKPMTPEQLQSLERLLVFGLKKHVAWAPHACMLRAQLEGKLVGRGDLEIVGKALWHDFYNFKLSAADTKWVLNQYRTTRRRPNRLVFYEWLRFCGLRYGIVIWHDCIRMLRQISPSQGSDFIDMIERHLLKHTLTKEANIALVTDMYGNVIKKGYPFAWPPIKRHMHANYDRDARITSALQLCRMLNSPDDRMVRAAATSLSFGSGIKARPETSIDRWRLACQGLFGGKEIKPPEIDEAPAPEVKPDPKTTPSAGDPKNPKVPPTSPEKPVAKAVESPKSPETKEDVTPRLIEASKRMAILAVWSGKKEDLPDYSLTSAINAGRCQKGLRPAWRCVSAYWDTKLSVQDHLRAMFIKTRFLEQADLWQIPTKVVRARPEKTLPRKMMKMDDWKVTKTKSTPPKDTPQSPDDKAPVDQSKSPQPSNAPLKQKAPAPKTPTPKPTPKP